MFDKITKETIEGTKSAKDFTLKKWKKFIRKRALKRVEKQIEYAQKKPCQSPNASYPLYHFETQLFLP